MLIYSVIACHLMSRFCSSEVLPQLYFSSVGTQQTATRFRPGFISRAAQSMRTLRFAYIWRCQGIGDGQIPVTQFVLIIEVTGVPHEAKLQGSATGPSRLPTQPWRNVKGWPLRPAWLTTGSRKGGHFIRSIKNDRCGRVHRRKFHRD